MGQVLYRKYRSRTWDEVVGQEHVTTTLKHAIKNKIISHAYLFTGPRGVGKTSVARILAYAVNDMSYDNEATQLDIIEIDAASNRRIDEIRDLRERIHITPTIAKYKVYIIDEVHMLTREAFNALLKILEEPPEHVIFILATTEPHKLPETIISRTQRFSFHPISIDQLVEHLSYIAKTEKIEIDDEALKLIAIHGDGSFRDSISLLDQVRGYNNKISAKEVHILIGDVPNDLLNELTTAISKDNQSDVILVLHKLISNGYEPLRIAKQLASQVREDVLSQNPKLKQEVSFQLLRKLIDIPSSIEPSIALEIALLEAVGNNPSKSEMLNNSSSNVATPKIEKKSEVSLNQTKIKENTEIANNKPVAKKVKAKSTAVKITEPDNLWSQTLEVIKQDHNTLYGILRMAQPEFSDSVLTLKFGFKFHQQRVKEVKNFQVISQILYDLSGQNYSIVCVIDETAKKSAIIEESITTQPFIEESNQETSSSLEAISSIFGGGEIVG